MAKSDNVKSTPNSAEPSRRIIPGITVGHTSAELDAIFSIVGRRAFWYRQGIAVPVQSTAINDSSDEEIPELIPLAK